MLFNNHTHAVSFLSAVPAKLRETMHPALLDVLEKNGIAIGETLDELGARAHEVLGALTGVARTREECAALLGGRYCLTGDALLKVGGGRREEGREERGERRERREEDGGNESRCRPSRPRLVAGRVYTAQRGSLSGGRAVPGADS